MALVTWVSASAALGSSLYPARTAALFTFLVGFVIVVTLRATITFGLTTAAFGAVLFTAVHLAMNVASVDPRPGHLDLPGLLARPISREEETWAGTIVAIVVLMVSSLLADVVSVATARLAGSGSASASEPEPAPASRLDGHEAGLLKAEWELTRAATYRRRLTLGLIGPDPEGEAREPASASIAALDRLLCDTLTAFDVICAYRPGERLIVMPEEPSERVAAAAEHLCEIAGARLGRPVRMSVAGFPEDGSTLPELLRRLDQRLGRCRESEATVEAGQAPTAGGEADGSPAPPSTPSAATPNDHAPPTEPLPGREGAPARDPGVDGEVEVLEPFELPVGADGAADEDEAPEGLRTVLQDPWSALEVVDDGPGPTSDHPSPASMTHGPPGAARQPRAEPSTTPAG